LIGAALTDGLCILYCLNVKFENGSVATIGFIFNSVLNAIISFNFLFNMLLKYKTLGYGEIISKNYSMTGVVDDPLVYGPSKVFLSETPRRVQATVVHVLNGIIKQYLFM